jgi:hypothetical protein
MKKIIFLLIAVAMIIGSCAKQKTPKIEGAWNLVYLRSIAGDTLQYQFPGEYTGSDMKIWSKDHFAFVGLYKKDTSSMDGYGGGTYTLKDNRYDETIVYHSNKTSVGQTVKMIIEIKNDTLCQTWPVDDNGKIDSANYRVEKYVKF